MALLKFNMSVHQHRDGRWFVTYRKIIDGSKKGSYAKEYFGRGPEAEKKARQRNDDLGLQPRVKRTPPATHGPLFYDLATAYYSALEATAEPSTLKSLDYKIKKNLMPFFGKYRALRITAAVVDRYVKQRLYQHTNQVLHRNAIDILPELEID